MTTEFSTISQTTGRTRIVVFLVVVMATSLLIVTVITILANSDIALAQTQVGNATNTAAAKIDTFRAKRRISLASDTLFVVCLNMRIHII